MHRLEAFKIERRLTEMKLIVFCDCCLIYVRNERGFRPFKIHEWVTDSQPLRDDPKKKSQQNCVIECRRSAEKILHTIS